MRLRRLEPVVRRALAGPCRVPPGATVLVAVSGGADSTALLLTLHSLKRERSLELRAAHLNHRLRGRGSDEDQAFVAALCARLGVPLLAAGWDTRARMRRRGLSGENGLRALRREFLESAARRLGADVIATAHTADDQLETVLMRLLRGSGLRGLGGMRPRQGRWIKPLLLAARLDVERDLRALGQPWCEDPSNAAPLHARNRIRLGVIPALLEAATGAAGPAARAGLALRVSALATELREVERALLRLAAPLARRVTRNARSVELPAEALAALPRAARSALWRSLWRRLAPGGDGLTAAHLRMLDHLAAGSRGPVGLPRSFRASLRGSTIRLERAALRGTAHDRSARSAGPNAASKHA